MGGEAQWLLHSCFNDFAICTILKESSFILNADLQNRYRHLLASYMWGSVYFKSQSLWAHVCSKSFESLHAVFQNTFTIIKLLAVGSFFRALALNRVRTSLLLPFFIDNRSLKYCFLSFIHLVSTPTRTQPLLGLSY